MSELSKNSILYEPDETQSILGVVQIVHGMAEHQNRYKRFATFLRNYGYVVITSDLRGHGDNVARETDLGYFGDNAVSHLVDDIHEVTLFVKDNYPKVPYILLGHSMGTLICTAYFKKYDNFVDGLFLTGMPGDNAAKGLASLIIKIMISLKGEYHRSNFINALCNGPFSRPFKKEGEFGWLSVDRENVKRYEDDPKCGFIFTLNGFATLMELMDLTYSSGSWIKKQTTCPIRLFSGEDDPCMGSKSNFMNSVHLFTEHGYDDVAYILYPNQRHEILNDTEKMTAFKDILNEIDIIRENYITRMIEAEIEANNRVINEIIDESVM